MKVWFWGHEEMTEKASKFARQLLQLQIVIATLVVLGVAALGVHLLSGSHAATSVVAVQPEQGTIKSPAVAGSVATASNGGYVKFGVPITSAGWEWPVRKEDLTDLNYGLSQCWLHYYSPKNGYHPALDIRVNYKPVYAAHNGTVVTKANDGYNTLIINTGTNQATGKTLYMVYEHMSVITIAVGDKVTVGEQIGTSGEVGAPNAPHLHFGISDSASAFGVYANPWHTANPLDFLPDYTIALTRTTDMSCKTADIKNRSDFGFATYQTSGTFSMYK